MKHYCPMCGEQWDDDTCASCGWREGKPARYTGPQNNFARRLIVEERMASKKSPVELASDIGAKAHDLYQHGDHAARSALNVVATVNPEMLAWLRDRLLDITQQRPLEPPTRRSQGETPTKS